MKRKYLAATLSGLLYLASGLFSNGEESAPINKGSIEKEPLRKEIPAEIVTEAVEKGSLEKRDVINFISRIDDEKIDSRHKYREMGCLEGFCEALTDRIEEDPFFYFGEEYDENEIIVKNQMLNAAWDMGVAKFPKILGRLEKTGVYIKKKTTLKANIAGYKFRVNPELDNEDLIKLKTKVSCTNSFINGLEFKVGKDDIKVEKSWYFPDFAKKAEICLDVNYDWNSEEYCVRISLKVPFWPEKPVGKNDVSAK